MFIRKDYIGDDVMLGVREIVGNRDDLIKKMSEAQWESMQPQIANMKSESRIIEWLNTRILLFEMLGEEKIIYNHPNGKPFLLDKSYKISISHTRGYVAILLSKSKYVGVDIEFISDRIKKVADKFISSSEYIDPSNEVVHQLLHWSAKETLFKIMKEGEVDFKEHLYVYPFKPQKQGIFEAKEIRTDLQRTYKIHYEVFDDAVLTWTVDN